MADEFPELTDAKKLELRPGLARVHGALMRAWRLGMFVPRDAEDERVVARIRELLVLPEQPAEPGVATPLGVQLPVAGEDGPAPGGLTLLTDDEFLTAFDGLVVRYKALARAYERGMAVAETAEQAGPAC